MSQKYVQEAHLKEVFDLSKDWFVRRKDILFFEKVHFIIPPTESKTKKAVLWDITATEATLRGECIALNDEIDQEIKELLERRGA